MVAKSKSKPLDAGALLKAGAKKAKFPSWIAPQLAKLVDEAPDGKTWMHETKFDGYRILAFCNGAKVRLLSRNRNDWTSKFAELERGLKKAMRASVLLDGELCVLGKTGNSSFEMLQHSFKSIVPVTYTYFVFDILFWKDLDLRAVPLLVRKKLLQQILADTPVPNITVSKHTLGNGKEVFKKAAKAGLEGIISKDITSAYLSTRSDAWLKIKSIMTEEFAVIGFTNAVEDKGTRENRAAIGALLLGFKKKNEWVFCGKVGTGFSQEDRLDLMKKLKPKVDNALPFANGKLKKAFWVSPVLVAQVSFTEWTSDGKLRHPSFLGLRLDKAVNDVNTTPPSK